MLYRVYRKSYYRAWGKYELAYERPVFRVLHGHTSACLTGRVPYEAVNGTHTAKKCNKMQQCFKIYYSIFIRKPNMFRATHRLSSGAYNCTSSLWFCIILCRVVGRVVAGRWQRPATTPPTPSALSHGVRVFWRNSKFLAPRSADSGSILIRLWSPDL
jgi:hypothetical protein